MLLEPDAPEMWISVPLVVVGPQLLRTHWQARLVPSPSGCGLATTVVGMLVCRAVFLV